MSSISATLSRRIAVLAAAVVAAALVIVPVSPDPAHGAETSVTVLHTQTTAQRGTPGLTYYECPTGRPWDHYTAVSWAPAGCWFEIAFTGHTVDLLGNTRSGHGRGEVYVDGALVGTVNYGAATNSSVRKLFSHAGLTDAAHTLRVVVVGNGIDHASAIFTTGTAATADPLLRTVAAHADKVAGDYTAAGWPAFEAARASATALVDSGSGTAAERAAASEALEAAASGLVMIRGLRQSLTDYDTRVPTQFQPASWTGFAAARQAAAAVLADADATVQEIVAAKNALQESAAALVPVSEGSFQKVTNNTFWHDTDGNPIFSQGGGIFRFGDTYYWYGVRYVGAELYYNDPTRLFNNDDTFVSIPVYSSTDLVNWTFENEVATKDTPLHIPEEKGVGWSQMSSLADAGWLGRMGVAYNENTGKYVLPIQIYQGAFPDPEGQSGVLLLQGDSPTDDFEYGNVQRQIQNSPTQGTGDQTVFTDDDGNDYLVFSNASGRARAFVAKLAESDSLTIEPGVQIGQNPQGREGNAMFALDDRYYMAASALHGWNTSPNYVIESLTDDIQGEYSEEFTLPGTERDYSHVTQTGFFVTVEGTKQDFVLYAGDRWADFAWNGLGYNQWVPITKEADGLQFHSLSDWEFNATTGEWRVGAENNYVLNPEFSADRIRVSSLTGWDNRVDADSASSSIVTNPSPGAGGSRWSLQLGAASAFSGGVSQSVEVPDGVYRFDLASRSTGGLEYARAVVTGGEGERYEIDLNRATAGWENQSRTDLVITGGEATITLEARGEGGRSVTFDALSLRAQQVDKAALQSAYDEASTRVPADHTARSWGPFDLARSAAADVLADVTALPAEVDAARNALLEVHAALAVAVVSLESVATPAVYPVGASFAVDRTTVTARLADGSTRVLTADEYAVSGFAAGSPRTLEATIAVAGDLAATGESAPTATVAIEVLAPWDRSATYQAGARVYFEGSAWLASWWTRDQVPGDPYGPWQQHLQTPGGQAPWTPSRIFVAGDEVVHDGGLYRAAWWTRNQSPSAGGPWQPIG